MASTYHYFAASNSFLLLIKESSEYIAIKLWSFFTFFFSIDILIQFTLYSYPLAVCPTEETTSRNGSYLWPLTFPNRTVTLACQGGVGNVSRVCHKVGNQLPKWGQVNVENCKSTEDKRSKALENLENVSNSSCLF